MLTSETLLVSFYELSGTYKFLSRYFNVEILSSPAVKKRAKSLGNIAIVSSTVGRL